MSGVAGFEPGLDGFEAVSAEDNGSEIREASADLPAPVVVVSSAKPQFFTVTNAAAQVKGSSHLVDRFLKSRRNRRRDLFG